MADRARTEQAARHFIDAREELQQVDDEWREDPDNAAAFERVGEVWDELEAHLAKPEMMRMAIAAQDDFQTARRDRLDVPEARAPRRALVALAASLVLMATGLGYYSSLPDIYETGSAESLVTRLSDGSTLTLDSESRVEVDVDSDKRRFTLLNGRANFAVAKDPLRPFVVYAGNKQVVATGTEFSVELINSEVRVVLYEGHVSVSARPESKGLIEMVTGQGAKRVDRKRVSESVIKLDQGQSLVAGDAGTLSNSVIEQPESLSQAALWKSGQLHFDAEPLPLAVARINRYTNREIVLEGSPALQNLTVSGVFRPGDVDAFADGIAGLYDLHVVEKGDQIVVTD